MSIKCDGRIFNSERRRPTNPDGDWCDFCVGLCLCAAICSLWFTLFGHVWTSFCLYFLILFYLLISTYTYWFNFVYNLYSTFISIHSKPCPSCPFNLFSIQPVTFRVSLSFAAGPDAVREEEAGKDDEKAGKSHSQMLVGFLL